MRSRFMFLTLLFVSCSIAVPSLAHATIPFWGPIIPAGVSSVGGSQTCPLGWAGVILVINNIISFALTFVLAFFAPLMFAYGGFLYLTSGESPGKRSEANTMMLNLVVGVVIALASWLIVSTLLGVVYNQSTVGGPWYSLITTGGQDPCIQVAGALQQSTGATAATGGNLTATGNPSSTNDCPGALICGTDNQCERDPQLDNGSGEAGQPCVQGADNCNTSEGLACDNSDTCSSTGTTVSIPTSCTSGSASAAPLGATTAQCPSSNTACSASTLQTDGLNSAQANAMSCIAITESSGNPATPPYNTTHPGSNSSACGTFQITQTTWNGAASGACANFASSCENAACNAQVAATLVSQSGFSSWTCAGCNAKAASCVATYDSAGS